MKNRLKITIQVVNLLLLLTISTTIVQAETALAANFLTSDGTLNMQALANNGHDLTLNLEGWHIELDPKRGPVFSPKPSPASSWSALDKGLNSTVWAITVSGTDVYVGGDFRDVGTGGVSNVALSKIAKWNGTNWSGLGTGLHFNSTVKTIAVSGPDIYVGGALYDFNNSNIAKWNGIAWSTLGGGLNGPVNSIAISGTDIYVGGSFTDVAGGTSVSGLNNIAKWNGTAWSPLDKGLFYASSSAVFAIAVSGNDIYVGGSFLNVGVGGTPVLGLNNIAKWNGTAWSALDKGLGGPVHTIAVMGTDIYMGGSFNDVPIGNPSVPGLNFIAKWNGTIWSALDKGVNGKVNSIAIGNCGIYVGGEFTTVGTGGTPVSGLNRIANWNGTAWSAFDMGVNSPVYAVAVNEADVYTGGGFTDVGTGGTSTSGLSYIGKYTQNLLTNPGFDAPIQPTIGENFLFTYTFNGWTMTGGPFNIIRTNGTTYAHGPDNAKDGTQYAEIYYADGTVYQDFTLSSTTSVAYGGYFSSRLGQPSTANITIYSMPSNIPVSPSIVLNPTTIKSWQTLSGAVTLPAGTYRYVADIPDDANFDAAYVYCVLPTVCIWTDAVNNNWSNPGNWLGGQVPTPIDDVVINSGTAIIDVAEASVKVVNMTLSGGTLTSNTNKNIGLTGNLDWSGGTIGGTGTMTVAGTTKVMNSLAPKILSRTLTTNGLTQWLSGNVNFNNGHFINNGILRITAAGGVMSEVAATTNSITICGNIDNRVTAPMTAQINVPFMSCHAPGATPSISGIGTLTFNGTLVTDATIRPGMSPGTLIIHPAITATAAAIFEMEITGDYGSSGIADDADKLESGGNIALNGTLKLILTNPERGSYTIFNSIDGNVTGFNNLNILYSVNGGAFSATRPPNTSITQPNAKTIVVTITGSVLDVELLDFKVKNTEGGNLLTWQTANETNNKGFQIERSVDGKIFENIGFVKAKSINSTYNFTDNALRRDVAMQRLYYRLRQIDNDGKETLSKVVNVRLQEKGFSVKTYPNPFKENVTIEVSTNKKTDVTIELIDILGRQIFVKKAENTEGVLSVPISTEGWANGTYFLKISDGQEIIQQKVIKH